MTIPFAGGVAPPHPGNTYDSCPAPCIGSDPVAAKLIADDNRQPAG
jgi:hypothetical protein